MATDANLTAAIDAIINKANTLAASGQAEDLVYLAKTLETVGPASTIRHLVQIGESERARVISTGDAKVSEVNTADRDGGPRGCSVYTSNSTWYKPSWCKKVRVQLVGGGGGSGGHQENGGAGGYSEKIIDNPASAVAVTVGGGGARVNYGSNAGNGGTSSFGSYLSATGGYGGHHSNHSGGRGGVGAGGNINLQGGGGAGHGGEGNSSGAASYFGGGAPGAHHNGGEWYQDHGAPGSGGGGQWTSHNNRTVNGKAGIVIVWEYE
jgi:hypothetical protein